MIVVLLAEGFEEIEAIGTIDILRRANFDVKVSSITGSNIVKSARNVNVIADTLLDSLEVDKIDAIVLPGGSGGVDSLNNSCEAKELIKAIYNKGKVVAAICAAPTLLSSLGIIKDKMATCYPGLDLDCKSYMTDPVVVDNNIITSRGAGTTQLFASAIIEKFKSKDLAEDILKKMIY